MEKVFDEKIILKLLTDAVNDEDNPKIVKIILENTKKDIDISYRNNELIRHAIFYRKCQVAKLLYNDMRTKIDDSLKQSMKACPEY